MYFDYMTTSTLCIRIFIFLGKSCLDMSPVSYFICLENAFKYSIICNSTRYRKPRVYLTLIQIYHLSVTKQKCLTRDKVNITFLIKTIKQNLNQWFQTGVWYLYTMQTFTGKQFYKLWVTTVERLLIHGKPLLLQRDFASII